MRNTRRLGTIVAVATIATMALAACSSGSSSGTSSSSGVKSIKVVIADYSKDHTAAFWNCLLYTSPSPRD